MHFSSGCVWAIPPCHQQALLEFLGAARACGLLFGALSKAWVQVWLILSLLEPLLKGSISALSGNPVRNLSEGD